MYDTILVPIDGSDGSNRAIEHGLELGERYGAGMHAIYVVDTRLYGEPGLSSTELVVDEIEDRGQEFLADFAERADDQDLPVETRCCHGVPHREIVDYANQIDADVIVLGFQGHTHKRGGNIGSVAERVIRTGERPVFTV
jgi:nucleotide-binding universal stress UspA family protein